MNTASPFAVSQDTLADWVNNIGNLSDELSRRGKQIEEMTAELADMDDT